MSWREGEGDGGRKKREGRRREGKWEEENEFIFYVLGLLVLKKENRRFNHNRWSNLKRRARF